MMRRILLRVLVLVLTVSLFTVPIALADLYETPGANIQLNGELMDFPSGAFPFYDSEAGKVYVPFRDLFEALGYTVDYDDATGTISASLDNVTIEFNQNDSDIITVTRDDATETLTMDVPAITVNDRVLVPVRFVSETIGANVGWDQANHTVLILDSRSLLAGETAEYTILDKLLKMQTPAGNYAGTAVLDLDLEVSDPDLGNISMPIDMTMEIISSETIVDAKFSANADISAILGLSGLTADYEIDGEIIMNLETGLIALNSDALLSLLDPTIAAGTWLTMDYYELFAGMVPETDSLQYESADDLMNWLFSYMIDNYYLTSVNDFGNLDYAFSIIRDMYSDDAFVKSGNDYTSTFEATEDGITIKLVTTLKTNSDEDVTSVSIAIEADGDGIAMTGNFNFNATDVSFDFSMEMENMTMTMKLDIELNETTKTPRTDVPEGAETLDITDFI